MEEPPQESFVIEDDDDEKLEEPPTAFEFAFRKAADKDNGDNEIANMLSELEEE
jgi:hypothetical protein